MVADARARPGDARLLAGWQLRGASMEDKFRDRCFLLRAMLLDGIAKTRENTST